MRMFFYSPHSNKIDNCIMLPESSILEKRSIEYCCLMGKYDQSCPGGASEINVTGTLLELHTVHDDGLTALFTCVKKLGLASKFWRQFPVGGSVPVIVISLWGASPSLFGHLQGSNICFCQKDVNCRGKIMLRQVTIFHSLPR